MKIGIFCNKTTNKYLPIQDKLFRLLNTRGFAYSVYETMEDLDEIDKFLDRYQVLKLIQDQINDLKSPISPKEIEAVINSLPMKKKPRNRWV